VGPYVGINATLRLLEHRFRNSSIVGGKYEESTDGEAESDARFSSSATPISAVALSNAQSDAGLFELSFKDERYLPFEGAGLISRWRLEFSPIRQFDLRTISDVILQVKYTASEGGERLKRAALESLKGQFKQLNESMGDTALGIILDLKNEFPREWSQLRNGGKTSLTVEASRVPYYLQALGANKVNLATFLLRPKTAGKEFKIRVEESDLTFAKTGTSEIWQQTSIETIKFDSPLEISADVANIKDVEELFVVLSISTK
jgi:Tc toxin complex TcA C-terminal TcB-binding domain